ncbi:MULTISPECIES: HtaA domain-containing protein [Streptomyces]|uniref:HtaA domain-containing protein n=1 Tax=Streptomyces TaxID=1883 RepID=UPI00196576E0|nr:MULTISPECIES: HtaA domain-containing protein [Streptomyces]QRX90428.1 HtaA domain-containing protein [Streptomyces noursei]UJB40342.1 HtaA domain-containing protein [Streptomyces sp. A1-5]
MAVIRRPLVLAAALAIVSGSAALGLPAVALASPAPAGGRGAPAIELKDGTLDWGVKESFRTYVTGLALGKIETANGARQAADNGPFTFVGGTGRYDLGSHAVTTAFQGGVRFVSALHGFDIRLADVKVSTDAAAKGRTGVITADVTADGKTKDEVRLASLDLSKVRPESGADGAMTFAKIPAKLTAQGAEAFNGMYQEGQELDPATLTVRPATGPGRPEKPAEPGEPGAPGQPGRPEQPGRPDGEPGQPQSRPGQPGSGTGTGTPSGSRPAPGTGGQPATGSGKAPGSDTGSAPAADSGKLHGGNLDWGVKKKFRDYVNGPIAHGKAEPSDGATATAAGFRFPKGHGTYDGTKATLVAEFNGAVRFTGHGGALDLKFSNLRIKAESGKGTLIADVASKPRTEEGRAPARLVTTPDTPIAELKLPSGALTAKGGVVTLKNVPATLTAAGSKAFSGMYPAGEPLDPVGAAVAVEPGAQLPSGATGSDGSHASAGAGAAGGADSAPGASFSSGSTVGGTGALAATGSTAPNGALIGTAVALLATGAAATYVTRRGTTR